MPILAHCEHGLIIDVFGKSPVIVKSDIFKTSNNKVVSFFKDTLKFINLNNPSECDNVPVSSICELQISPDGCKVGAYSHEKKLYVFEANQITSEFTDVESFGISNNYYCIQTKSSTRIFRFGDKDAVLEILEAIRSIHVLNTMIFFITEKTGDSQKLLVFRDGKIKTVLNLPNIYRIVFNSSVDEERVLLLIDTEYTKNSYYADSTLFLLGYSDIESIENSCKKSEKLNLSQVPDVFIKSDEFIVLKYNSLVKIHSVGFLKDSFYVCFGDQPASLYRYTLNGKFCSKYPRTIRNVVAFNRKEDRIVNGGFGNLPGNIEVYNSNQSTCSFELLGSSIVSWLNNDCYFMIAITNYFKSENKIAVYDYYGRLIEEMTCKSLATACVYGDPEDEVKVERPVEIMKPKPVAAYVPPHLQTKLPIQSSKKPVNSKVKKPSQPRSKEMVEKELNECQLLRERLRNGEELTLEEQNKAFRLKELQEELSKFN